MQNSLFGFLSTISTEVKRGTVIQLNYDLSNYKAYFSETVQVVYEKRRKNCGAKSKLPYIREFIEFDEKRMLECKKWSLGSIVGNCKNGSRWKNKLMFCTKTRCNYIDRGFLKVRNIDL